MKIIIWKNLTQKKKAKHEPSGWAMFTKCSFDEKENKLDYCRRKDCIEKSLFIPMNISIAGKNLMKSHYHLKNPFIVI